MKAEAPAIDDLADTVGAGDTYMATSCAGSSKMALRRETPSQGKRAGPASGNAPRRRGGGHQLPSVGMQPAMEEELATIWSVIH